MIVAVVLVLACLAVLAAVVALAMGRGGELSAARRDLPPPPPYDDRPFTGPAPFTLPRGLWGYQIEMTDQAMGRLRRALYERDARMAALEHQVAELRRRVREISGDDRRDSPDDYGHQPQDSTDDPGQGARDSSDDPGHGTRNDFPGEFQEEFDDDQPEPSPWAPPGATRVDLVKNNASAGDGSAGNEARS